MTRRGEAERESDLVACLVLRLSVQSYCILYLVIIELIFA
jgi:hypothetical protein